MSRSALDESNSPGIGQGGMASWARARMVDVCLVLECSTTMKFTMGSSELGMSPLDNRYCQLWPPVCRWRSLDLAVKSFNSIIRNSSNQEQIAIVTFASDTDLNQPGLCGRRDIVRLDFQLSTNTVSADATIDLLSSTLNNGSSNISAGIQAGIDELTGVRTRSGAERLMIVVTDGTDSGSTAVSLATTAATSGIKVQTVTLGLNANQTLMQSVASAGGGTHSHATTESDLVNIFRNAALALGD